jgi:predicted regulator of Ras-like GTPase activity (Roadblock/LC7/MglB family)
VTAPKRRASVKGAPAPRDTDASAFARILAELVARIPGAQGAVLVDGEGEAVDYAGRLDPFDLKLAGAHWQLILSDLRGRLELPVLGKPRSVVVRGVSRSFIVHPLPDGYVLVLVLGRRAGFTAGTRAFAVCTRALALEAGWSGSIAIAAWFSVEVESKRAGAPARLRHGSLRKELEILGRLAPLGPRERGWRVRLENGAEVTLVREPGNHWYADEALDSLFTPTPATERRAPLRN